MSKRGLILLILLFFLGITAYLTSKIWNINKQNSKARIERQSLANFSFYTLDSTLKNKQIIERGIPVCVIHFNTECEHCQEEAKLIHMHIKQFKNAGIIMVSPNPPIEIRVFSQQYGLDQYPQIILLWDKEKKFQQWFGNAPFPSTYIYNKAHQLVKEYRGEVKIEAISKYLD
ncbi:MAG: peroxiredoxin family protein [Sediminibacterium sp.]